MINLIIPLECPEKDDHKPSKNTTGNYTSGMHIIKIPRFDSGTPEEWIIFVNFVHKALVQLNVTTCPPMYECMERELKGNSKAKFTPQANLVGSWTVGNITTVMVTMTKNTFQ